MMIDDSQSRNSDVVVLSGGIFQARLRSALELRRRDVSKNICRLMRLSCHPRHPPTTLKSVKKKKKIFRSFSQRLRTAAVHPSEGLCQILYQSLTGPSGKAFIPRTSFSWLEDDWWACQRPIRGGGGRGLVVAEAGSYCPRFARKK